MCGQFGAAIPVWLATPAARPTLLNVRGPRAAMPVWPAPTAAPRGPRAATSTPAPIVPHGVQIARLHGRTHGICAPVLLMTLPFVYAERSGSHLSGCVGLSRDACSCVLLASASGSGFVLSRLRDAHPLRAPSSPCRRLALACGKLLGTLAAPLLFWVGGESGCTVPATAAAPPTHGLLARWDRCLLGQV